MLALALVSVCPPFTGVLLPLSSSVARTSRMSPAVHANCSPLASAGQRAVVLPESAAAREIDQRAPDLRGEVAVPVPVEAALKRPVEDGPDRAAPVPRRHEARIVRREARHGPPLRRPPRRATPPTRRSSGGPARRWGSRHGAAPGLLLSARRRGAPPPRRSPRRRLPPRPTASRRRPRPSVPPKASNGSGSSPSRRAISARSRFDWTRSELKSAAWSANGVAWILSGR